MRCLYLQCLPFHCWVVHYFWSNSFIYVPMPQMEDNDNNSVDDLNVTTILTSISKNMKDMMPTNLKCIMNNSTIAFANKCAKNYNQLFQNSSQKEKWKCYRQQHMTSIMYVVHSHIILNNSLCWKYCLHVTNMLLVQYLSPKNAVSMRTSRHVLANLHFMLKMMSYYQIV